MLSFFVPQIFKIPLHIPSFTSSSSYVSEKVLMPTSSSLPADTIHVSSPKTSIPITTSTSEAAVIQSGSSPLLSAHITMPMPSVTINQTSPLVSMGIYISRHVPESTQSTWGSYAFYSAPSIQPLYAFPVGSTFLFYHPSSIMFQHVYVLLLHLSQYNDPCRHPLHLKF